MSRASLFEVFGDKEIPSNMLRKVAKEVDFDPGKEEQKPEEDKNEVERQRKLAALEKTVAARASKKADEGGSEESRSDERPADESPGDVKRMETRGEIARSGTEVVKSTGRLKQFFLDGDAKEDPKAVAAVSKIGKAVTGAFKDMVGGA